MNIHRFLSYTTAFMTGAGLWWIVRDDSSPPVGTANTKPILQKRNVSSVADVFEERLNHLKSEEKKWQDRTLEMTVREEALELMRKQPEFDRQNLEKLAQLKAIANGLKNTKDLRPALYSALVADDADYSLGIFLEWHRRDAAEAFDEMAKRPDWFSHFCWEECLLYELTPSEIIYQINQSKRSQKFRLKLSELLANHLATQDNLADLQNMWNSIGEPFQNEALYCFTYSWIPDNGKQAAEFLINEFSEEFRNQFFDHMLTGIPNPKHLWTDEFSKALLSKNLGSLENRREETKEEAERISNSLGDSFYFPRGDANDRFQPTENTKDNARYMSHGVKAFLLHRKDYPQLFQNGLIEIDQIREAMIEDMPAAAEHKRLLDAALFEKLLFHHPAKVIQWAAGRIPSQDLANLCAETLREFNNSRAEQSLQLLEAIPSSLADQSPLLADQRKKLQNQVDEWRRWSATEGGEE